MTGRPNRRIGWKAMSMEQRRAYRNAYYVRRVRKTREERLAEQPPKPAEWRCNYCDTVKPLTAKYFQPDAKSYWGVRKECRVCNKRKVRAKRYGMSVIEYEAMRDLPCGICGGPSHGIDHCHRTGKVRAGLCMGCNTGLGAFCDDPARLRQAALYLEAHAPP